jgi:hypothetical protein
MNNHASLFGLACGVLLVLTTATSAYAQQQPQSSRDAEAAAMAATHKMAPAVTPLVTNAQTAVGANLCFTCGGDWPVFAGFITTPSAADERGSGCTGGFGTTANDHEPFLCSR